MTTKTFWIDDIKDLHTKFGVREVIETLSPENLKAFIDFRLKFLQEELDEAKEATEAEDVVDAMIDLCVVAIGTLDAVGVDSQIAWDRVHKANMSKQRGIKKERPNPLGLPDLIKPEGWTSPQHYDNTGILMRTYGVPTKWIKQVDFSFGTSSEARVEWIDKFTGKKTVEVIRGNDDIALITKMMLEQQKLVEAQPLPEASNGN